jgi:DHA1 family tetracycline resistance protein-like MFS transporter
MAIHSVWNYYTMARYGWDEQRVGISLAVVGVCFGLVQAALAGPIVKKLGEKGAATLGLVILSVVTVGIGLIPYGWMMYFIILPYAFSGIVDPSIRSLVSSQVKNNEQGELQGIFTSLMSLAEMTGPLFMMWIFYKSVPLAEKNPVFYGSPFFVAATLAVIALVLLRYVFSKIAFKAQAETLLDDGLDELENEKSPVS